MDTEPVDTRQAAYRAGRVLRVLDRPLRVTEPCVGLGGFRRLCEMSDSPHCFTQAFDSEESLKPYYARLAKDASRSAGSAASDRSLYSWAAVPAVGAHGSPARHIRREVGRHGLLRELDHSFGLAGAARGLLYGELLQVEGNGSPQ